MPKTPGGPQFLKYLLSSFFQKKFGNPCPKVPFEERLEIREGSNHAFIGGKIQTDVTAHAKVLR